MSHHSPLLWPIVAPLVVSGRGEALVQKGNQQDDDLLSDGLSTIMYKFSPPPDGSNLDLKWSCGHEGYLNLDWLRKHCYSAKILQEGREKAAPLFATQVSNF